ncbi:Serine/threonine kinase mps1 [Batrachochytrium dendrobatidis]
MESQQQLANDASYPQTPAAWYSLITAARTNSSSNSHILALLKTATQRLPMDQYRNDPLLLNVWLEYLSLLKTTKADDVTTIADAFKLLKAARVGASIPRFHLSYAAFESSLGHMDKAESILSAAIAAGLQPSDELQSALSNLVSSNEYSNKENSYSHKDASACIDTASSNTANVPDPPCSRSKSILTSILPDSSKNSTLNHPSVSIIKDLPLLNRRPLREKTVQDVLTRPSSETELHSLKLPTLRNNDTSTFKPCESSIPSESSQESDISEITPHISPKVTKDAISNLSSSSVDISELVQRPSHTKRSSDSLLQSASFKFSTPLQSIQQTRSRLGKLERPVSTPDQNNTVSSAAPKYSDPLSRLTLKRTNLGPPERVTKTPVEIIQKPTLDEPVLENNDLLQKSLFDPIERLRSAYRKVENTTLESANHTLTNLHSPLTQTCFKSAEPDKCFGLEQTHQTPASPVFSNERCISEDDDDHIAMDLSTTLAPAIFKHVEQPLQFTDNRRVPTSLSTPIVSSIKLKRDRCNLEDASGLSKVPFTDTVKSASDTDEYGHRINQKNCNSTHHSPADSVTSSSMALVSNAALVSCQSKSTTESPDAQATSSINGSFTSQYSTDSEKTVSKSSLTFLNDSGTSSISTPRNYTTTGDVANTFFEQDTNRTQTALSQNVMLATPAQSTLPSQSAAHHSFEKNASCSYTEYSIPLQSDALTSTFNKKDTFTVNGTSYQRIELVGRGASSKVFKVLCETQPNQTTVYALKKVKLRGQDPSVVDGYINEISLLKKLAHHERIIRLVDAEINMQSGVMLMVLEYGEIDLAHLLKKSEGAPLSINFIRNYWEQMLQAVQAIHDQNIIHSDLKPANFLMVEGCLKLIDFGIAKTIPNDTTNIQRDHQTGTANYMAPEAIVFVESNGVREGYVKLGRASDVWSLGCILYQFVYGHPPFGHMSLIQKLHSIVDPKHKIIYPPTEDTMLPLIIQSCLQRNPKLRLTIQELLDHEFLHPDSCVVSVDLVRRILKQAAKIGLNNDNIEHVLKDVMDTIQPSKVI